MTLHITRAADWREASKAPITKAEVDRLILNDPDLAWSTTDFVDMQDEAGVETRQWMITVDGRSSFIWYDGQLECSAPDDTQLAKLRDIARALSAMLVDDDGERHDAGDAPSREPVPAGTRRRGWLVRSLSWRHRRSSDAPLQFSTGDRVRDSWGHEHTVLAIDRAADHGLGSIRTRRSDGTEHCRAVAAHGFVRVVTHGLDDQADTVCPVCRSTVSARPSDPTGWRPRMHGGGERVMPLQQGRCDGCKKTFLRAGLGKMWGSWLEIDQGVNESARDAFNRTQTELARQIMHPDGPDTRE